MSNTKYAEDVNNEFGRDKESLHDYCWIGIVPILNRDHIKQIPVGRNLQC